MTSVSRPRTLSPAHTKCVASELTGRARSRGSIARGSAGAADPALR